MRIKIEEEKNIKTVVYKRYVDDINLIVEVEEGTAEIIKKIREMESVYMSPFNSKLIILPTTLSKILVPIILDINV